MKYSNEDKRKEAMTILAKIESCNSESELEEVDDYLDSCLLCGCIFKKDYKYLSEKIDDQIMTLVEKGLI